MYTSFVALSVLGASAHLDFVRLRNDTMMHFIYRRLRYLVVSVSAEHNPCNQQQRGDRHKGICARSMLHSAK